MTARATLVGGLSAEGEAESLEAWPAPAEVVSTLEYLEDTPPPTLAAGSVGPCVDCHVVVFILPG